MGYLFNQRRLRGLFPIPILRRFTSSDPYFASIRILIGTDIREVSVYRE